jgi:hypothetical protein
VPALQHLAKRLADMDRDAVQQVLTELREVVGEVRPLLEELTRRIDRWLSGLPDEQERFRTLARELKNKVSVALGEVLRKYDDLAKAGQPIAELDHEIASAVQDIHQWVSEGLGEGSLTCGCKNSTRRRPAGKSAVSWTASTTAPAVR